MATTYKKPNKKVLKAKRITGNVFDHVLKIALCVLFAFPFYWMIITSFKTFSESIMYPPTMYPHDFTVDSYIKIFREMQIGKYLKNSLIVLFWTTLGTMLTTIPAAYAFARYKFKGRDQLFGFLMIAFMAPQCLTFITVFKMFAHVDMLNSLIPQIVPCICSVFNIFMLRQNFMQIPEELIESAKLDEANEFQIITKIMLPMAKSTVSTILFLHVIGSWNSYFWPLMMTVSDDYRTLPVAVESLKSLEGTMHWPTIMAGNMIILLPVLIVFIFASKKIIAAMAYKGVK